MGPMERPRATEPMEHPSAEAPPRRRWDEGCRLSCLLTAVHPERGLSRALVQHLTHEMPDIRFTLDAATADLSAVWVCGFEPGAGELVRAVRRRHPDAFLVVTGRGPVERWIDEVRAVGADHACTWPVPYALLSRVLHRRRTLR